MNIGLLIVCIIWFAVRVILQMPTDTPLFYGDAFLFADSLAVMLGVFGVAGLIGEASG